MHTPETRRTNIVLDNIRIAGVVAILDGLSGGMAFAHGLLFCGTVCVLSGALFLLLGMVSALRSLRVAAARDAHDTYLAHRERVCQLEHALAPVTCDHYYDDFIHPVAMPARFATRYKTVPIPAQYGALPLPAQTCVSFTFPPPPPKDTLPARFIPTPVNLEGVVFTWRPYEHNDARTDS